MAILVISFFVANSTPGGGLRQAYAQTPTQDSSRVQIPQVQTSDVQQAIAQCEELIRK